jgi:hypothetical protein
MSQEGTNPYHAEYGKKPILIKLCFRKKKRGKIYFSDKYLKK